MSRHHVLLGLVLLVVTPAAMCHDDDDGGDGGGQPQPGPIIVIDPSDGDDATSEWTRNGSVPQTRTTASGGRLREDFIGTKVKELTCDGADVSTQVVLTLEGGGILKIKRTSIGLQWCWDLGGGSEACLIPTSSYTTDTIPLEFKDATDMTGDGTPCSQVRFQVEKPS